MNKNVFLGINENGKLCCILQTLATFEQLEAEKEDIESSDFEHDSTDWYGCDRVDRTLQLRGLVKTGREIALEKPITFYGKDYDTGHMYSWRFTIFSIIETKGA